MCLIIARRKDTKPIAEETIVAAASANQDGFGLVAKLTNGKVVTDKTLDMSKAVEMIRKYEELNAECVFHFRLKTHGSISLENTHPFKIKGDNYMAHNGILSIKTDFQKSDTAMFAEKITNLLPRINVTDLEALLKQNDKIIGGSKLAFLGNNLPLYIYNEKMGHEIDGNWFSNKNWQYRASKGAYGSWDDYYRGYEYSAPQSQSVTTTTAAASKKRNFTQNSSWTSVYDYILAYPEDAAQEYLDLLEKVSMLEDELEEAEYYLNTFGIDEDTINGYLVGNEEDDEYLEGMKERQQAMKLYEKEYDNG